MKAVTYKVEGQADRNFESVTAAAKQLVLNEGLKVRDVAKALGLEGTKGYLAVYVPTKGQKNAEKRLKKYEVARRRKIGQTPKQIAEKMGMSMGAVLGLIKKTK